MFTYSLSGCYLKYYCYKCKNPRLGVFVFYIFNLLCFFLGGFSCAFSYYKLVLKRFEPSVILNP